MAFSVVVIAKDAAATLARSLRSVAWTSEIVVIDAFSDDDTVAVARSFTDRVWQLPWRGFAEQRNAGAEKAAHDWILCLDADEVVSEELRHEIEDVLRSPRCDGYRIPMRNYVVGRWMRFGGLGRQMHLRLYNRRRGTWVGDVHETVRVDGRVGTLKGHMLHYAYESVSELMKKIDLYTDLEAAVLRREGKARQMWRVWWECPAVFVFKYVWQLGILDGYPGLLWAGSLTYYRFIARLKALEGGPLTADARRRQVQIFTRHFLGGIPGFHIRGLKPAGGAEVYIQDLAGLLISQGHEVEVVQAAYAGAPSSSEVDGIRIRNIALGSPFERALFPYVLADRFAKYERPGALKIYSYVRYAVLRPQRSSDPAVGITHGIEWDTNLGSYLAGDLYYRTDGPRAWRAARGLVRYIYFSRVVPFLIRRGGGRVNVLVSVDRHSLKVFPASLRAKTVVIPNYVDLERFHPGAAPIQGDAAGRHIILVPRNLNVARGVHLIPEVARLLLRTRNDFVFYVLGSGPLRAYLEQRVTLWGLGEYVKLLGHVDRELLPRYYTASTIILIPSIFSEGTSMAVLEGMASARPVVMTTVGGLAEIGQDGESKVSVSPHPQVIAGALDSLLRNPERCRAIGTAAYSYVAQHHSKKLWEKRWLEVLQAFLWSPSSS